MPYIRSQGRRTRTHKTRCVNENAGHRGRSEDEAHPEGWRVCIFPVDNLLCADRGNRRFHGLPIHAYRHVSRCGTDVRTNKRAESVHMVWNLGLRLSVRLFDYRHFLIFQINERDTFTFGAVEREVLENRVRVNLRARLAATHRAIHPTRVTHCVFRRRSSP